MKSRWGSLISTVAAALGASCCVLPLALLTLGFTSLGPFVILMRYRPVTLTFSFVMLATAFYVVYRPQATADCASGVCSPQTLSRQRRIVWLSTGLMIVFVLLSTLPIRMTM
ncbi:MAG TPA: mercuric transporter MerT family protein [Anaerolineales bacterium]|nr:mercuric transporter MerT family protein [Anaerolineales bacterium]